MSTASLIAASASTKSSGWGSWTPPVLLAVAFVAAGLARPAGALEPGKTLDQYVAREWKLAAGLPQASVSAIAQTSDRYLWVGTFGGLARFDGVRFRTFRIEDGVSSLRIISLLVDSGDTLWVGTEDAGVARLEPGSQRFVPLEGVPPIPIWAFAEDEEGTVWIGTDHGLLAYDPDHGVRRFDPSSPLSSLNVSDLLVDRRGRLWVSGRDDGLMVREEGVFRSLPLEGDSRWVLALAADLQGTVWAYSGAGLLRVGAEGVELISRHGEHGVPTAAMLVDGQGSVWFGGPTLARWSGGEITRATNGLQGERVRALFEDGEGTLWIGTDRQGLFQLSDGPLTTLSSAQGVVGQSVLPVTEGPDGAIWVGTRCGGLSRFDGESFHRVRYDDRASEECVFSLLSASDGTLWISDVDGLAALRGGTLTRFGAEHGLPEGSGPRAMFEDRKGKLWFGTAIGLFRLDGDRFTRFSREDGLVDDRILFITQDEAGALWIGAERGLSRWRDGVFTSYHGGTGLPAAAVRAVLPDGDAIWIGTYGGGLARLENGIVTRYLSEHGLYDEVISSILPDDRGNLWICGNRGLFTVARQELEAFAHGEVDRIGSVAFGVSDGMKSPECNGGGQPSAWRASDGKLWFATIDGVVVLDPERRLTPPTPPVVIIETIATSGRESGRRDAITLGPDRDLEVHYTGISFAAPERVRFRYRLHGFDEDWVTVGPRRAAYYTNLPGGRYRFEVAAGFEPGEWASGTDVVSITVRPRFRETWGFVLVVAAGVALASFGLHRLRIHHLKAREAELSALVAERTRELVASHEQLERLNERKNELLGMVAHDLRNPLGAILSYSELVKGEVGREEEKPGRFLGHISSLATHTLDLVNQLLDVSAIEAGLVRVNPAPLFLPQLMEDTVSLYRVLATEKEIELELRPIHEVTVLADGGRLEEILSNLLSNAVKFTPHRGHIEVWSEAEAGSVRVFVHDSGPGLGPSELGRVFRGGRLSARPTGGESSTGFGLVIVRKLVELHGGQVRVRSVVGKGATFSFTLPLAA